jgi:hypothetical protein
LKIFYLKFKIKNINKSINTLDNKIQSLNPWDVEFYKVFDYITEKKAYWDYKVVIDDLNKVDRSIKNIADLWRLIDQVNNWIEKNKILIEELKKSIKTLYYNNMSLEDFKIYRENILYINNVEKEKILSKQYREIRRFIYKAKPKIEKLNNKEYILATPEYSWITRKSLIYSWLIRYSRIVRYLSHIYFEQWKYEKWINLLLEYQWFMDNLSNKTDYMLIWALVNMTINRINIEALEYFIDNYDLSDDLKYKIKIVLEKNIDKWLIKNTLKWEYKNSKEILNLFISYYDEINSYGNEKKYKNFVDIIKIFLFYSHNESNIILKKYYYDKLNNKGEIWSFIVKTNINNYLWRKAVKYINYDFSTQFKKEEDLYKLRSDILEKVK